MIVRLILALAVVVVDDILSGVRRTYFVLDTPNVGPALVSGSVVPRVGTARRCIGMVSGSSCFLWEEIGVGREQASCWCGCGVAVSAANVSLLGFPVFGQVERQFCTYRRQQSSNNEAVTLRYRRGYSFRYILSCSEIGQRNIDFSYISLPMATAISNFSRIARIAMCKVLSSSGHIFSTSLKYKIPFRFKDAN